MRSNREVLNEGPGRVEGNDVQQLFQRLAEVRQRAVQNFSTRRLFDSDDEF